MGSIFHFCILLSLLPGFFWVRKGGNQSEVAAEIVERININLLPLETESITNTENTKTVLESKRNSKFLEIVAAALKSAEKRLNNFEQELVPIFAEVQKSIDPELALKGSAQPSPTKIESQKHESPPSNKVELSSNTASPTSTVSAPGQTGPGSANILESPKSGSSNSSKLEDPNLDPKDIELPKSPEVISSDNQDRGNGQISEQESLTSGSRSQSPHTGGPPVDTRNANAQYPDLHHPKPIPGIPLHKFGVPNSQVTGHSPDNGTQSSHSHSATPELQPLSLTSTPAEGNSLVSDSSNPLSRSRSPQGSKRNWNSLEAPPSPGFQFSPDFLENKSSPVLSPSVSSPRIRSRPRSRSRPQSLSRSRPKSATPHVESPPVIPTTPELKSPTSSSHTSPTPQNGSSHLDQVPQVKSPETPSPESPSTANGKLVEKFGPEMDDKTAMEVVKELTETQGSKTGTPNQKSLSTGNDSLEKKFGPILDDEEAALDAVKGLAGAQGSHPGTPAHESKTKANGSLSDKFGPEMDDATALAAVSGLEETQTNPSSPTHFPLAFHSQPNTCPFPRLPLLNDGAIHCCLNSAIQFIRVLEKSRNDLFKLKSEATGFLHGVSQVLKNESKNLPNGQRGFQTKNLRNMEGTNGADHDRQEDASTFVQAIIDGSDDLKKHFLFSDTTTIICHKENISRAPPNPTVKQIMFEIRQTQNLTFSDAAKYMENPEQLTDRKCSNVINGSVCGGKEDVLHTFDLSTVDYLVVRLIRFVNEQTPSGTVIKKVEPNFTEFNPNEQLIIDHNFRLVACLVHSGDSPDGGHYWTIARAPDSNDWWRLEDYSPPVKQDLDLTLKPYYLLAFENLGRAN